MTIIIEIETDTNFRPDLAQKIVDKRIATYMDKNPGMIVDAEHLVNKTNIGLLHYRLKVNTDKFFVQK